MKPAIPAILLGAAMAGPAAAPASSGGRSYPESGGVAYGEVPAPAAKRPARAERPARRLRRPVLARFDVRPARIYAYGATPRVTFRIDGRDRHVRVRLAVLAAGSNAVREVIDLGPRPTGVLHSVSVPALGDPARAEGPLRLRLSARDSRRRLARPAVRTTRLRDLEFRGHRFPLAGPFSYGGAEAGFGADRGSHRHQGQDLLAAEGTPVVAPRGGTVEYVQYQATGAGHYVILDGDGEDRDYAFMHLRAGSIGVREGQRVRTGARIGEVGSTGRSSAPHLHFEIWEGGGWYAKGRPVDPLPHLKRWESWSPVRATG